VERGQRSDGFRWRDHYWTGPGEMVDEWLAGDDSEIIMDRALDFVRRKAAGDTPFLVLVWFHAPHTPVVAGNEDRSRYPGQPIEAQHWFGCLTALDRQVGRLREELRELGIAENTLVWYCSDNGPSYIHDYNSAGPFRGKKATLLEGGVRVPAILEWPARFGRADVVTAPCCTSDFYPTILSMLDTEVENQPPLDGIDLMPLLDGETGERSASIAFQSPLKQQVDSRHEPGTKQLALSDDRYKIISFDDGKNYELYDLLEDPGEGNDLADEKPDVVARMRAHLEQWVESCARSARGRDYVGSSSGSA